MHMAEHASEAPSQGHLSVDGTLGGGSLPIELPPAATIDRQTKSKRELLLYACLLVLFDVGKQITSYALKYYNDDVYPVEQTLIVFLTEDAKLIMMVAYLVRSRSLKEVTLSLKFAVPSILYTINNNLYLYAFHFTTPAVWNILTQSRIIITALIYRLSFKKHITRMQWLSLCVLAFAISLTQVPSGATAASGGAAGGGSLPLLLQPTAVVIAALCSLISVAAGIFVEYSFKNDKRSFGDQQLQLCLFAALASLLLYRIEAHSTVTRPQHSKLTDPLASSGVTWLTVLLVVCVVLGAVSGLITGIVIKRLDNIVKIYSQSLCGVVNAIMCMIIFPSKFSPDWHYCVSLLLVVVSIIVYEQTGVRSMANGFIKQVVVAQNGNVKSLVHNEHVAS